MNPNVRKQMDMIARVHQTIATSIRKPMQRTLAQVPQGRASVSHSSIHWHEFVTGISHEADVRRIFGRCLRERQNAIEEHRWVWDHFVSLPEDTASGECTMIRSILAESRAYPWLRDSILPQLEREFGGLQLIPGSEVVATAPFTCNERLADFYIGRFERFTVPRQDRIGVFHLFAEIEVKATKVLESAIQDAQDQFHDRARRYWERGGELIIPTPEGEEERWQVKMGRAVHDTRMLLVLNRNAIKGWKQKQGFWVASIQDDYSAIARAARLITRDFIVGGVGEVVSKKDNLQRSMKRRLVRSKMGRVHLFPMEGEKNSKDRLFQLLEMPILTGDLTISFAGDHFLVTSGAWWNRNDMRSW